MSGNSIQERIQMRINRLSKYEEQKDSAMKYFDDQIETLIIKISHLEKTIEQYRAQKTASENNWDTKIKIVKLQIQQLQNS